MSMPVITPSQTTCCQAITDIINSVSMQQSAISHIINAEGEKIQKVLTLNDVSPDQILKVNRSVEETLRSISQLEFILKAKLQLFQGCLCTCTATPVIDTE